MHRLSALLLWAALCGLGGNVCAAPPPGFRAIFNEKDLSGWFGWNPHETSKLAGEMRAEKERQQREQFADNWTVAQGELINDGRGPYATTRDEFGDVELLLEYRTVARADSGIYLRGTPQVQIWDATEAGGKWDRGADKGSGGLFNNSRGSSGQLPLVRADKAFGEWNAVRVRQVGSRTWVWLNEQPVVVDAVMENYWDRSQPLPARGPILLQTHGGEIRWRNIFVRDIASDEAARVIAEADAARTDALPVKDRFHLYLLIGQSNMAGRGVIEEPPPVAHPRVLKFTREMTWAPGADPLHFDKPFVGVGLGTSFAAAMAEADPNVTIGLIPSAVGGTPLSRWERGGDLYSQAVERAQAAMKDGLLKGILWHQGEADAMSEETAKNYAARLSKMVGDLRGELGAGSVPFVAGELGRYLNPTYKDGSPSFWPVVNGQIDSLPKLVTRCGVASSEGLVPKSDNVHFDTPSLREFGRRYAAQMQAIRAESAQSAAPRPQ